MKEIPLLRGPSALVDDDDYERLKGIRWYCNKGGYAAAKLGIVTVYMHRVVVGLEFGDGRDVDHINGNRLDNRSDNLRVCTHSENLRNRGANANNTSGLKGVTWEKRRKKWQAAIKVNYKTKFLGYFNTPEEAHRAYCDAAEQLHGEFANFG